ncbi:hypothetical protein RHMOL_Rhmol06G0039300 [Rhododendron molle]|uniref:Uncharacterized protein n=1 Tax=Rhododendron molle TaxID=49168 RepID=A0ACC0N8L1_RHOML|nr:hypothetical protein RHMOL_Rhmol06G0039300 [Rhododendron molle]
MEVMQVLHMNKGEGETSYAKNSTAQREIISIANSIVEEAVVGILCTNFPESLGVADLGCSSGPNTFIISSEIIDIVHATSCRLGRPIPELRVSLNDLPGNDFNCIFKALPEFYKKLKEEKGGGFDRATTTTTAVTPLPPPPPPPQLRHHYHRHHNDHHHSTIIITTTTTAAAAAMPPPLPRPPPPPQPARRHAAATTITATTMTTTTTPLSSLPSPPPPCRRHHAAATTINSVNPGKPPPPPPSRCHHHHNAATIMTTIIITIAAAATTTTINSVNPGINTINPDINTVKWDGLVEEEKIDSFNAPYYAPCPEELNLVVQTDGSFLVDRLETFEFYWEDQMKTEFEELSSGQRVAKTIRAVAESMIESHFGKEILDVLFRRYGEIMDDHLSRNRAMYVDLVVSLIRMG